MIDTQTKRRAVLGLISGPRILPVPDAVIDAAEREYVHFYGVAIEAGIPSIKVSLSVAGNIERDLLVAGTLPYRLHVAGTKEFELEM